MTRRATIVGLLFGCLCCAACGPRVDVLARVPSPTGNLDAVDARPRTGATVGFVDWVYVVPEGEAPSGSPVFVADNVQPRLAMSWSGEELTISAQNARVFRSTPQVKVTTNTGQAIARIRVRVEVPQH